MGKHESKTPLVSSKGLRVLSLFADASSQELSGADVHRLTGLASGTLYPILMRFEQAGWLESRWEEVDPRQAGRPRKRFYRITGSGVRSFQELVDEILPEVRAWASVRL